MDSTGELVIGIVLFLVVVIFSSLVIIGWYRSDQSIAAVPINPVGSGGFLSPCPNTECSGDLVCDGNTFLCKFPEGKKCNTASECVVGLICSGICTSGKTGGVGDLCPCDSGLVCVEREVDEWICKGGEGFPCSVGIDDCASGFCESGKCAGGFPNSFPCTTGTECGSKTCEGGFCQNPGVITGTLGAACSGDCVEFQGAGCSGRTLVCECLGVEGVPGTCVFADQGIFSPCSFDKKLCTSELVCYNDAGVVCNNDAQSCQCVFSYDNPNNAEGGTTCINGMVKSEILSECFNAPGLGCDIGGDCASSVCSGGAVLAFYSFETQSFNLGTNYIGAQETAIKTVIALPTGVTKPHKIFCTSNGSTDTVYLVDQTMGLYSLTFTPGFNPSPPAPWSLVIPGTSTFTQGTTTTTRKLIDSSVDNFGGFFYVFDQTITEQGMPPVTNDVVLFGPDLGSATFYNPLPGTGSTGTQYTQAGVALSIDYISAANPNPYSPPGLTALITSGGTGYINQGVNTKYNIATVKGGPMNGTTITNIVGPALFYYDQSKASIPSSDNISFVGSFNDPNGITYKDVVQFSGGIAGASFPIDTFPGDVRYEVYDYAIYSPKPAGFSSSGIIMLTKAYKNATLLGNIVSVVFGGRFITIPYRVGNNSICGVSNNAFYVTSPASCN